MCRNPMYFGMMMIMVGSSHLITMDRIVFVTLHIVCIMYGVVREEQKMKLEFDDFDLYIKKVPNKYIPDLRRLWT
jgi:protein-S-isoprenylcysteine O-methyltransferase Ste14